MKTPVVIGILIAIQFQVTSSSAQDARKDFVAFQAAHPTIKNVNMQFVLIPSSLPAHQLRDRDGLVMASALNTQTRKQQNVIGEYSLRGTPSQLTLFYKTGRVEKWEFLGNNRHKIVADSNDNSKVGKIIQILPLAIDGSSKAKINEVLSVIRKKEAALTADFVIGKAMRKANEKFAKKLGL